MYSLCTIAARRCLDSIGTKTRLASFDRALTIEPDDAEALTNRGVALYELNRFAEALTSHDKALAINSGYVDGAE